MVTGIKSASEAVEEVLESDWGDEERQVLEGIARDMPKRGLKQRRYVPDTLKERILLLWDQTEGRRQPIIDLLEVSRENIFSWRKKLSKVDYQSHIQLATLLGKINISTDRDSSDHIPREQQIVFLQILEIMGKRRDGSRAQLLKKFNIGESTPRQWKRVGSEIDTPLQLESSDAVSDEKNQELFALIKQGKKVHPLFRSQVHSIINRNEDHPEVQSALQTGLSVTDDQTLIGAKKILRIDLSQQSSLDTLLILAGKQQDLQNKLVTTMFGYSSGTRSFEGMNDRIDMIYHLLEVGQRTDERFLLLAMNCATPEERGELGMQWGLISESEKAQKELWANNVRLVDFFAEKYGRAGDVIEDNRQWGQLGLHRAIQTYNPEEFAFNTYAQHWIKLCITRNQTNKRSNRLRLPTHAIELLTWFNSKQVQLEHTEGGKIDQEKAMEELELTDSQKDTIRHSRGAVAHISEFLDDIPSHQDKSVLDTIVQMEEKQEAQKKIQALFKSVDPRTADILLQYFDEDDGEASHTSKSIGNDFGISGARTRDIIEKGKKRLEIAAQSNQPSICIQLQGAWEKEKLWPIPEPTVILNIDEYFSNIQSTKHRWCASEAERQSDLDSYPKWLREQSEAVSTQLHTHLLTTATASTIKKLYAGLFLPVGKNKLQHRAVQELQRQGKQGLKKDVGKHIASFDTPQPIIGEVCSRMFPREMERDLLIAPILRQVIATHLQRFRPSKGPRGDNCLIDLGAGRGYLLQQLCRPFRDIYAVENNTACIDLLSKRAGGRVKVIEEDLRTFVTQQSPFVYNADVLLLSHMLYYFSYRARVYGKTILDVYEEDDENILSWAHNALHKNGMMLLVQNDMVPTVGTRAHLREKLPRATSQDPFPQRAVTFLERRGCPTVVSRPTLQLQAKTDVGKAAIRDIVRYGMPTTLQSDDGLLDSYLSKYVHNADGHGTSIFNHRLHITVAYKSGAMFKDKRPWGGNTGQT